jgi:hypothetical protein
VKASVGKLILVQISGVSLLRDYQLYLNQMNPAHTLVPNFSTVSFLILSSHNYTEVP